MTTLDVLIAVSLIPLVLLVIALWFDPVSRFPWHKIPELVLGPYVLYAAFAAWHFHASHSFVLVVTIVGVGLTIMGVVEKASGKLPSTTDKEFLKLLEGWLRGQSEVMIFVRYTRVAGKKSFEFFTSFSTLKTRLTQLEAETNVMAFRKPQLPVRGRVDDEFIGRCLSLIPAGSKFLVLETDPPMATQQWLFRHEAGEGHIESQEVLEGLRGRLVAVGPYPHVLKGGPDVISAYVPHQDGRVKAGVY